MDWDLGQEDEEFDAGRDFEDEEDKRSASAASSSSLAVPKSASKKGADAKTCLPWRECNGAYQPKVLKKMVAASRKVIMGTRDAHVIRVALDHTEDLEDIGDLAKKESDRVSSVFMDPLGAHVVVSLANGDNFYLNESWKKPKPMPKMKEVVVSSVAWDVQNSDKNCSQSVLVGTGKGQLFECVLDAAEKGTTKVWRPLFNTESNQAIEGLAVERLPNGRLYVMAVTATRIYEFFGSGSLSSVFEQYDTGAVPFHELPGSSSGHAELHLLRKTHDSPPSAFAWMAESGVFHGALRLAPDLGPGDSAMLKATLLKYPDASRASPISMAMTEHHFLFVYADRFQAVRRLDDAVVFEQALPQRIGKVQGLCVDETQSPRLMWVYSESALFEVGIVDEDREISSLYLKLGQFDLAKQYAKTQAQVGQITSAQADHLFEAGKYEQAAVLYGKTDRQFEEIALKFIDKEAPTALRAFLVRKLQTLTLRDSTQKTMICTWLTEIFLNRLNALQEADDEASREEMQAVTAEFRQMLEENKAFLDYKTTVGLITSHGRVDEMIYYANLMEDFERVINAFITKGEYKNALVVLQKQTSEDLFYRFSPVLMHHAPYHTVNSWMRAASFLKPRKLIPALMRYDPANNPEDEPGNQAIRYLEFCTKKIRNDDEAIHNYLLSLYCQNETEEKVCEFISEPETHFDLKYALRLCSQHKLLRGQVLIYGLMNLYEEAVELALNFDLELAKVYASKPEDDDPMKKRLWLRIAKHVVTGEGNIKKAMAFLKECSVLKIEDILPFFPEFTLIDNFKDEICESLESYNLEIEQLRETMDQSTQSADEIRSDIQKLNQNYGFVEGQQRCQICEGAVLTREFYLFPCQHVFHADCLVNQMVTTEFDDVQRHRYTTLMGQIKQLEASVAGAGGGGGGGGGGGKGNTMHSSSGNSSTSAEDSKRSKIAKLKSAVDDLVAPECVLCGIVNINQIIRPFIEDSLEARSWSLRSE